MSGSAKSVNVVRPKRRSDGPRASTMHASDSPIHGQAARQRVTAATTPRTTIVQPIVTDVSMKMP